MKNDSYRAFLYLKIFLVVVVVLVIGSIIYKAVDEVTHSQFKNNAFSVLYVAKDAKLIYVDKNAKSAVFLAIGDVKELIRGKNALGVSLTLGFPVNALIIDEKNAPQNIEELVSSHSELRLIFDTSLTLKGMNKYDVHKFLNALKNSIEDKRIEQRISLVDSDSVKKIEEYFIDSSIINSPLTIEIDNGTSINGLGSDFARVLSREGYNVIAVRTVPHELTSYIAFTQEDSYTDSLLRLTGFIQKRAKVSQAADITIFLGDDLEAMLLP